MLIFLIILKQYTRNAKRCETCLNNRTNLEAISFFREDTEEKTIKKIKQLSCGI